MSRLPWKIAVGEVGLQLSSDMEEPPRTRSSEEVQSRGDHGLRKDISWKLGEAIRIVAHLSPPNIDTAEKIEAILQVVGLLWLYLEMDRGREI